jgi:hypothetical protein
MRDVDEGVESLLGIGGRWRTLHASGLEWRHHAHHLEAFERGATAPPDIGVASFTVRFSSDLPEPDESEESWALWIEKPDLKRAEFSVGGELVTVVFRGDYWWSWSRLRGASTNDGRTNSTHGAGPSEGLLSAQLLPGVLQLEELPRSTFLGREVITLRGLPRTITTADDHRRMMNALHVLGLGADEYLLALDAEHGVLLRSEARIAGEAFCVLEMTQVSFDAKLDADTWVINEAG